MIKILVVEDEPSVAGALKMILEDRGYIACVAMTGREGIGLAREHRFDVTISDYRLPDINGVEVLKTVSEINPCSSSVLITAHSTPELIAEAHACGIHSVLTKPFSPSEILTLLTSLVERTPDTR
jgi:DNA-binding NtrC family response regulator